MKNKIKKYSFLLKKLFLLRTLKPILKVRRINIYKNKKNIFLKFITTRLKAILFTKGI